jgi:hypothetical protein
MSEDDAGSAVEETLLAQNQSGDFITAETPLPEPAGKLIARFGSERKLPLAVALTHHSHSAKLNSFRGFGINE